MPLTVSLNDPKSYLRAKFCSLESILSLLFKSTDCPQENFTLMDLCCNQKLYFVF